MEGKQYKYIKNKKMSRRNKNNGGPKGKKEKEELTLTEKINLENLMIDKAFNNSFMLLTKKKTFDELMHDKTVKGASAILAHNPDEEIDDDTLENMMVYFEDSEEYEKCVVIRNILNNE